MTTPLRRASGDDSAPQGRDDSAPGRSRAASRPAQRPSAPSSRPCSAPSARPRSVIPALLRLHPPAQPGSEPSDSTPLWTTAPELDNRGQNQPELGQSGQNYLILQLLAGSRPVQSPVEAPLASSELRHDLCPLAGLLITNFLYYGCLDYTHHGWTN